jgi:cytochrome c-type biogenesis protein CcmE
MKKMHIIGLVIVAIAIGVLVSLLGDFSRYETFDSEYALSGKEINVVGELVKEKEMSYDPLVDANHFSFYLKDDKGVDKLVVYRGSMPRDFEKSEKIVVTGKLKEDTFYAAKILMKCPSKYVEEGEMTLEGKI